MKRMKRDGMTVKISNWQSRVPTRHGVRKGRTLTKPAWLPGFEEVPLPAYIWSWNSEDLVLTGANSAARQFARGGLSILLGRSARDLFSDQPVIRDALLKCLRTRSTVELNNFDFKTVSTGIWRLLNITCTYASPDRVVAYAQDITEQLQTLDLQRRLQAAELETDDAALSARRYRALIENNADIVAVCDNENIVKYVSSAITRNLGYDAQSFLGSRLRDLAHPEELPAVAKAAQDSRREPGVPIYTIERLQHRDGHWLYFECTRTNFLDDPKIEGIVFNARDITDRKIVEEQLKYSSFYDELTGLANRSLFLNHVEQAIIRCKRKKRSSFAALCIDVDRFKIVNDSFGHGNGDRLLVAVAHSLQKCVRDGDTAARLGSDEFAVLLNDVSDVGEITRIVERIQQELLHPIEIGGHELSAPVSIGITLGGAISQQHYQDPSSVLRDADTAMSRAKSLGKGRSEIFDEEMQNRALMQLRLEHRLRRAVENAQAGQPEFVLQYQPILSLQSGRLVGVEALVRWESPVDGLVSPADFIPIAEETGLIVPIGTWVLYEACRQMRAWLDDWTGLPGIPSDGITMSVNVSSRQFAQPNLVEHITHILEETGLPARHLKLEITESVIMENAKSAAAMLVEFRERGIRLSMDDFGTGYSSLAYLQRFPLDTLKIDRSFINNMTNGKNGLEIVRSIMNMAQSLGMDVVAEGIETDDQCHTLKEMNCSYGQGYLFSKPVHSGVIATLMREGGNA